MHLPPSPLVVASVPTDHVYVRHLAPPTPSDSVAPCGEVRRLADPTTPWWPPKPLEAAWVEEHAGEFDLMHVHFGFDARSPEQLAELVEVLDLHGKPLVHTVHDLRNPHHETPELHDAQLGVLLPAAAAVVTLTAGAADEIARRWGIRATVLPHPHVVDLPRLRRLHRTPRAANAPLTVGLHLKSLRACMTGVPVVEALREAVAALPDATLRVDVHTDVHAADGARHDPALRSALDDAAAHGVDVRVHDYFSDDELWDYLAGIDVSVLPYRWGTHSGWLEACRDLGTAVVAPDCGYYADQGAAQTFHVEPTGAVDTGSLVAAVHRAWVEPGPAPADVAWRLRQREELADAHLRIYRQALGQTCAAEGAA